MLYDDKGLLMGCGRRQVLYDDVVPGRLRVVAYW